MNDIHLIRQIEEVLGVTFNEVSFYEIESPFDGNNYTFSIDDDGNVNGLRIRGHNLNGKLNLLTNFEYLTSLNLSHCHIKEISSLQRLTDIHTLILSNNQISDISCLQHLSNIISLGLFGNKISDISVLSKLGNLYRLSLGENNIQDLFSLKSLKKLKELYLGTLIYSTTSSKLWISNIKLKYNDLNIVKDLNKLEVLDLSGNLFEDLSLLKDFICLRGLYLHDNLVSDISSLKNLKSLDELSLGNNPIENIPEWVINFPLNIDWYEHSRTGSITFFDNPLQSPPVEIVKQGKKAVKNWFSAYKKNFNEIKVLLVGEAKAGKTSLCHRLKYDRFNSDQNQTDGIVIESFKFSELSTFLSQEKLHSTTAYFWDFGGQEIMSSTHQFFMTNRSVYVLVLEARKDAETDKQVRQWLERIQAFGGSSPVIIVGNKIDLNPSFGIDTTALQRDFPQIKYFLNVSCETSENIEKLKSILEECISQAELFDTKIDERWLLIKDELQELTGKEYNLSHQQFIKICNKHKLLEVDNQTQAIRFLNDLGIVLHFDELNLSEYYVLDPLWVTAGVYQIITSETAARKKGEIAVTDLQYIINEEVKQTSRNKHKADHAIVYSPNECRFLADIMIQFKIGYYSDGNQKILIPDLLDKETPKAESEKFEKSADKLCFEYDYKYLPTTVIPNLIVELKNDVIMAWRSGMILSCNGKTKAEAMVVSLENKIKIVVVGDYKQKRDYLSIIRYFIDNINSSFNVDVTTYIPLPGFERHRIKYDTLLKMEKAGEIMYKNWDVEKEFEISKLLDGIITKEDVQKQAQNIMDVINYKSRKIRVFLASSFELKEDREQFEIFINRKNKMLFEKGIFLELVVWEDFLDAMSQTRLQDEYNKEIVQCDIFIMLFFTKVGMFTAEEFRVAYDQFKAGGKPLIYTYFKDSEITTGGANQKDLISMWEFQGKLKQLDHFYTVYKNIEELKYHFGQQLERILNVTID